MMIVTILMMIVMMMMMMMMMIVMMIIIIIMVMIVMMQMKLLFVALNTHKFQYHTSVCVRERQLHEFFSTDAYLLSFTIIICYCCCIM